MHTPSSSPQIRRAGPSDAQAVAAILTETYLTTWQPQLTPEAAMRFAQCDKIGDYVRSRLAEFHLACVNGTVAGMVDWENDFVWALHVSPRWQARGLGSTLLAHAEAAMAAAGHRQARLETDTFNVGSRCLLPAPRLCRGGILPRRKLAQRLHHGTAEQAAGSRLTRAGLSP
ncbi:N-acetyltransferase family protein [Cupriavidus basilensis]